MQQIILLLMQIFRFVIVVISLLMPLWFSYGCFAHNNGVIYVKPQDREAECPGQPCKTLDEYIISASNNTFYSNLTVILLEGHHWRTYTSYNYNHGIHVPPEIYIVGYGLPNETILQNLYVILSSPQMITMDGFTVQSSKFSTISFAKIIYRTIKITGCIFYNSTMVLFNTDLTISDSVFSHSPSRALTVTSSIITLKGTVLFSNNVGIKGGALALIGSTMVVAKNTNLTFVGNHALKIGGAVFVAMPFLTISTCFYQLDGYTYGLKEHNIKFINNSANNGGHHVYGASLMSNCYAVISSKAPGEQSYDIMEAEIISLQPGYNSSLSPVSDDASRVCICDVYGKPRCEETVSSMEVYPGQFFTIEAVVVGGDFGATYGTVNAKFLEPDDRDNVEASLESSNQYNQLVNTVSRCTVLNYTVYSNRSSEVLSLATEEQSEEILKQIDIDINAMIYKKNKSENTSFITENMRYSTVYINITLLDCPVGFMLSEKHIVVNATLLLKG